MRNHLRAAILGGIVFGTAASSVRGAARETDTSGNGIVLRKIQASISARASLISTRSALESVQWEENLAQLRSVRAYATPGFGVRDENGTHASHNLEAGFTGLDWVGKSRLSRNPGDQGSVELGFLLRNSEREKLARMGTIVELTQEMARLRLTGFILGNLKSALRLRVSLHRVELETRVRNDFESFLDTLRMNLRPYIQGRMLPPNSLRSIEVLRLSNETYLRYLAKEKELVVRTAIEDARIDSADFMAVDVPALISEMGARMRMDRKAYSTYNNRLDSLEYERACEEMEISRIRESKLSIGLGMDGATRTAGPMGKGYEIRLGWTAAIGKRAHGTIPRHPPMPHRIAKTPELAAEEELERSTETVRGTMAALIRDRLAEIRLGEGNAIYAISENLGRLLEQALLPLSLMDSRYSRAIQSAESLEIFGLKPESASGH